MAKTQTTAKSATKKAVTSPVKEVTKKEAPKPKEQPSVEQPAPEIVVNTDVLAKVDDSTRWWEDPSYNWNEDERWKDHPEATEYFLLNIC